MGFSLSLSFSLVKPVVSVTVIVVGGGVSASVGISGVSVVGVRAESGVSGESGVASKSGVVLGLSLSLGFPLIKPENYLKYEIAEYYYAKYANYLLV